MLGDVAVSAPRALRVWIGVTERNSNSTRYRPVGQSCNRDKETTPAKPCDGLSGRVFSVKEATSV